LKARIGGTWVDVGGGGAGADEVWVGPNTPTDAANELWVDTDDPNMTDPDTARWNSAWGIVGYATNTTGQTVSPGAEVDVTGLSVTFVPVVGRRYRTTISWLASASAAMVLTGLVSDGANAIVMQRNYTLQAAAFLHPDVSVVESGLVAVPTVRKARALLSNTASTLGVVASPTYPAFISVEDVGPVSPATAPAAPASVWTNLTLINGWTWIGGGWAIPSYRKVGDVVEVQGLVIRGSAMTSGQTLVVANIPVGFRPPKGHIFAMNCGGPSGSGDAQTRVQVDTVGDLAIVCGNAAQQTQHTYTSLSGISWSVST